MSENILRQRIESFASQLATELEVTDRVGFYKDLAKEMKRFAKDREQDNVESLFASIREEELLG